MSAIRASNKVNAPLATTKSMVHIRKYPVTFGNPSLSTYGGFVYTLEVPSQEIMSAATTARPLIEDALQVSRLVAVSDVPPSQVPEGILNLLRPHQPWIYHVRVVIAERTTELDNEVTVPLNGMEVTKQQQVQQTDLLSPSLHTSVMETAASMLAAEQDQQQHQQQCANTTRRTYLVLIELSSEEAAIEIVKDLNGQPYTILDESITCQVHHVVALKGVAGVSLMSPFFAPHTENGPSGQMQILPSHEPVTANIHVSVATAATTNTMDQTTTPPTTSLSEDYYCAVCLEHMDLDAPSRTCILTTVCNHSFHVDCILQCQDSPCPVCRYDQSELNETLSICHVCGTAENNYVCLICGIVSCSQDTTSATRQPNISPSTTGCGINMDECHTIDTVHTPSNPTTTVERTHGPTISARSHISQHYHETLHAYALSTETQHVWDFAGGGFVHRLLQNKEDGKLVEVHDPTNTTSHERSTSPGLSEAQESEVVHRKLEGFASQYYTLLKSQLEQQRIYYEGRLEEVRREHCNKSERVGTADLITALKQERQQLSQRHDTVQGKCIKVQADVRFIQSLNESLEANRVTLRQQTEQAQQEGIEVQRMLEARLPELQRRVTRLMLQLESNFQSTTDATELTHSFDGSS